MSTEAAPLYAVHVDALVGRLRAHAEAHEYIADADAEQRQWMNDLYNAADELERLCVERAILRDSAKDVIAWCDANPPAGDALYCITRLRHAIAAPEPANDKLSGRHEAQRSDGRA